MLTAERAACEWLHHAKLNKFPCRFGDECYRTNPHHLLHAHSIQHIPTPKPSTIFLGDV